MSWLYMTSVSPLAVTANYTEVLSNLVDKEKITKTISKEAVEYIKIDRKHILYQSFLV